MGLNKKENVTYLTVADGKIVLAHKQPTADTVERVNKLGKVVYEEHFADFEGKLVNIQTRDGEYGKQWLVRMEADGQNYQIQMPFSGRYSSSFLKALPNLDLNYPLKFKPWTMTDKNDSSKKVSGVTLYQNDTKVPLAYSKDNPNGLPEMKQVKRKGKMEWDDGEMMEFLEDMVNTQIVPQLLLNNNKKYLPVTTSESEEEDLDPEQQEEMPF